MIRPIFTSLATLLVLASFSQAKPTLNVLFINVDDMNCDSVGAYGCKVKNVTPHIDRLASEGMRFEHAHVTIAICQPTRAVWMTGRYPHNSGALGFDKIKPGVPTLPEALKEAGYYNGLMAKHGHVIPSRAAAFHEIIPARELKNGRSPDLYYERARRFFQASKKAGKPFFLMACSQDPHRPFAGSDSETRQRGRDKKNKSHQYGGGFPEVNNPYSPEEITVPGFLPDLPEIRRELAEYYTSVRRADAITGAVLRALDEVGLSESTIVMFKSDHGMPLPFAKTNCWHHSTHTPWMVRWPGVVKPGSVDAAHVVSGVDLAPTILDSLGMSNLNGADGRSFLPVLKGGQQEGREHAFTYINTIASKRAYPMRSIVGKRFGYIWNGWSDGKTVFRNESQSGLTWKSMKSAAATDKALAARVEHFIHRTKEELYDYSKDPDALKNLVKDPVHLETLTMMRQKMLGHMKASKDPELGAFGFGVLGE